jgi:hypothetical protein
MGPLAKKSIEIRSCELIGLDAEALDFVQRSAAVHGSLTGCGFRGMKEADYY